MVVIFEDTAFLSRMEKLFEQNNIPVKGWSDYQDLETRLRDTRIRVALLDIQIGNEPDAGLDALKKIKEKFPKIRTIMLTGHAEYVLRAFRLGADGYLLKEELPDAIQYVEEVMKGSIPMTDAVKKILVESLRPFERIRDDLLNTRELQIIFLAASDRTGPQIASELGLTPRTIETYLRNIRGKLDCHTIQGVVAKAFYYRIIDPDNFPS